MSKIAKWIQIPRTIKFCRELRGLRILMKFAVLLQISLQIGVLSKMKYVNLLCNLLDHDW